MTTPVVVLNKLDLSDHCQILRDNEEFQEVVRSVQAFHLQDLDTEWVANTFQSEFLDASELPPEYEALLDTADIYKALRATIRALDYWKLNKSWTHLSRDLQYRPLLVLLYHIADYGSRNVFTQEYRTNAVLAAQLYCKLLAVPGFKAYSVYHSQLFVVCLSCLGFSKMLCDNEENRLSARDRARDVNSYNTRLCSFLKDLKMIVGLLELTPDEVAFEEMLNHLMDLTGLALNDKLNLDRLELGIISQLSYDIIHTLLAGNNNEPRPRCIQALFKCLLPKLVATSMDCRASANVARAANVTYCAVILSRYGKAALFGYNILLQHLSFTSEGMERAEVRMSRVSLVVGLMSLLPKKDFKKFVDWILMLSKTAKAPHRLLALEIFSKLLNNNQDDDKPSEPQAAEQSSARQPSQLEPCVSAAAAATGEGAEPAAPEGQPTEADSSSVNTQDSTSKPSENQPPDINEDSQSSQENSEILQQEEDSAPVMTAQAHTVPYVKILQATYERANDVSSTVRVRALAILMSCITSDQPAICRAIRKLNGDGEQPQLMSLAVRYMGDERAAVRKSAVTLVDVQLRRDDSLLTKNNLGVLVSLCRDTSVLVRSTAVLTLGELMLRWPRDCTFDAFLAGPMRQLKDPEPKVQEQIQGIVENVLFSKLAPYSTPREPHHHLPWMFLSAVARHNMRRHLEKVCGMLSNSAKCINHRLIDTLSTHLSMDSENDLNCLVLLSAVARHLDYSNVDFLLSYYYTLAADLQSRDARLLPLLLEILTDWSRWFTHHQRMTLRSHLLDTLHNGTCGSEGSRRSCIMLAAHLYPEDVNWATEFLLACERRALEGGGVSECVCAADMSLVATEQPSSQFVQLLVSSATECGKPRPDMSESTQGCLVAGLGRMCVRSRAVAVSAAPTFAGLLVAKQAPICVRVNSLLALSDMCKRYTGIVEPLLGDICSCLDDSPPPLRRAAVRAITRLLLNDFLRLRAPLYYRYCALLADSDTEVREPVEYYVTSVLASEVIYHNFVDSLMYYNGCSGHSGPHSQHEQTRQQSQDVSSSASQDRNESTESQEASVSKDDRDDVCIDLPSPTPEWMKMDARQQIYDIMLQRMTPGQRLNVQCRLASEVLVHAATLSDEEEPLALGLRSAVMDTVAVLRGPHMRLPRKPQTETAMNVEDLTARVTSNILSHKMKRTVAEVLVPAVIRLYAGLSATAASRRTATPVQGTSANTDGDELANCLVSLASDLLKDYRQEIEELIDNDPELVEQISRFQEKIGEEPSFKSKHNIVIRDIPDVEATPLMRESARSRRTPLHRLAQPPTKRSLRL